MYIEYERMSKVVLLLLVHWGKKGKHVFFVETKILFKNSCKSQVVFSVKYLAILFFTGIY